MPASPTDRIYWDANVFLSVLEGDPSRGPIRARVRSSSGKQEIVTSTLSITEVAFGAEEAMGEPLNATLEDQIDSFWDDPSTIKLREFDRIVARGSKPDSGGAVQRLVLEARRRHSLGERENGRRLRDPHLRRVAV
jgi:hypothetical protein